MSDYRTENLDEEMAKRIWKITGYLGDKSIYERAVRKGALSEKAMIPLLQRLASRHLSEDEVVSSSLKQDDHCYCSALEIHRNRGGRDALMTTGSGHYYTALVEKAETKPSKRGHYKNRQRAVQNNGE